MNSLELTSLPSSRGVLSAEDLSDRELVYSLSEEASQSFNLLAESFDRENGEDSWSRDRNVSDEYLLTLLASNSKEIAQIFFKIWTGKIEFAGNIGFKSSQSDELMHKIIETCAHVRQEALVCLFTSDQLSFSHSNKGRSDLVFEWLERYPEAEELALMAIKEFRLQGRVVTFLKEQDEVKQVFRDKVAHAIMGWGFSLPEIRRSRNMYVEQMDLLRSIRDGFPNEKQEATLTLKKLLFESVESISRELLDGKSWNFSTKTLQSFFDVCPEYSLDIVQTLLFEVEARDPEKDYENQASMLKYIYGKNESCDQEILDVCLQRFRKGGKYGSDSFKKVLFFIMKNDTGRGRSIYDSMLEMIDEEKLIDFYRKILEEREDVSDDVYKDAYEKFKECLFSMESTGWDASENCLFFIESFPDDAPEFIPIFKKCEPGRGYINDLIKINSSFIHDALEMYRLANEVDKKNIKQKEKILYGVSGYGSTAEKVEKNYGELLRILIGDENKEADMPYDEIGNVLFESLGQAAMEPSIDDQDRHKYISRIAACPKVSILLQEKAWNIVNDGYEAYGKINHSWDAIWTIVQSKGFFSDKMKESLANQDNTDSFGTDLIPHCNSVLQKKIFTKMLTSSRFRTGHFRKLAKSFPHLQPILDEKGPLDVKIILQGMSEMTNKESVS